jgi:putative ABC transport system ATP-binding protein
LNDAGTTIVVITHEEEIAQCAKRVVRLRDGLIGTDELVRERRSELVEQFQMVS